VVQAQREARYELLRGYFHGADDDTADELQHERLNSVTLPGAGRWVGKTLESLALPAMGVRVVSLRRAGGRSTTPQDDTVLGGGDTLVLSGQAPALALAEDKLLGG
jgi:CPA2 family monovalent cation:H+ antiporter-2